MLGYFHYWLAFMSLTILIAAFYGTYEDLMCKSSAILNCFLIVNILLVLQFIGSRKVFYFFIIFEVSIIPIFLIITGWGYQPEKTKASYALFFFTAVSAGPLLLILTSTYSFGLQLDIYFSPLPEIESLYSSIQRALLLIGFLVKLPIYGAHLWLPLAHVEAPVYGSIILAGILLKLGGIGIIRFALYIHSSSFADWMLVVRLIGIILVGGICLYVTDLKKIIAFSSVSHIGFSILLFSFRIKNRLWVSFLILIVHAFRSSAIFFVVFYFYLFSNSRNLLVNIGIITINPVITFFWLTAIIARLGGPPAINLLAEIWAFVLSFLYLFKYTLILIMGFMLGRVYHFVLYRTMTQGVNLWEICQEYQSSCSIRIIFISFYHIILRTLRVLLLRSFVI